MSAITGSGDPLTISFRASAASWSGTAGRTISQPASLSSWIWRSVAFTSRVSVLVMVCTAIGAAPPMTTLPTFTGIDLRLWTSDISVRQSWELPRDDPLHVQHADHSSHAQQCDQAVALEVQLGGAVERPAAEHLDQDDHDAAAVEREQRQHVGEAKRDGQQGDELDVGAGTEGHGLARHVGNADRAGHAVRSEQTAGHAASHHVAQPAHDLGDRAERPRDAI